MKNESGESASKSTPVIGDAFDHITGVDVPAPLKKLRAKKARTPIHVDPRAELRRLVGEHKAVTKNAVMLDNKSKDRKHRATGEIIECRLPMSIRSDYQATAKKLRKHASSLVGDMGKALVGVPIYESILSKVWCLGPIASAYLVAMVHIDRSVKVSNFIRYCGWACDMSGRLERRTTGPKYDADGTFDASKAGTFNDDLRRVLWLSTTTMIKSSAIKSAGAPLGKTTKYLDVWANARHRDLSAGATNGHAMAKGRAKALAVLLEDVYTVWRASEGLPVWPSYHAAKLGYEHGGKIVREAPRMLSVDEALELVGDVGARPLTEARAWKLAPEEEEDSGDE